MRTGNICSAYVKARLFSPDNADASIQEMCRNYIHNELCHLPGSNLQFDRYVVASFDLFESVLKHQQLPSTGMPSCLYTHLTKSVTEKAEQLTVQMRHDVITAVLCRAKEMKLPHLPTLEQLMNARLDVRNSVNPLWHYTQVPRGHHQSSESHAKQSTALKLAGSALDQYINCASKYCPQNLCIAGGPGTGKTTVMMLSVLQGMAYGLIGITTALLCKRCLQLGSKHLYYLLSWPICQKTSPAHVVQKCIAGLLRDGIRL